MVARFKTDILMSGIRRKEEEEKAQQELKEEYGIMEEAGVTVRKKGLRDYSISALKGIGYLIYVLLVFFGLVTVINPISRQILLDFVGLL